MVGDQSQPGGGGPPAGDADGPTSQTDARAENRLSGRILDAPALRALAHPLRFRLVELLIEHGPSTASELGRLVGESSGLTSYHLRELAKHALIEEAPELGTARDRYWQPVKGGYSLEGFEMLQRDDTRADAQFLLDEVVRTRIERVRRWHDDAARWGREWTDATMETTARFRLTREEMAALTDELVALLDRYRDLQRGRELPGAMPDDAVAVTIQVDAFPTADPPGPAAPQQDSG